MKRKLLLFLASILCSAGIWATVYSGSCGENLTWSLDTETRVLDITGTGAMTNFSPSGPWYRDRSSIDSVHIAEGVSSIGNNAFYKCEFTKIFVPTTITRVGDYAFQECTKLKSIDISNVTELGIWAFWNCIELNSIQLGPISSIGSMTFYRTSVGSFPLPETLISIGAEAFEQSGRTSVVLPASVTSVSSSAFYGCKMNSIIVESGNPIYDSRNNCNAIIETATNKLVKAGNLAVIPSSVISIDAYAFSGSNSIVSEAVNPPTILNEDAFERFSSSSQITIPYGSLSAYQQAFGWSSYTNFVEGKSLIASDNDYYSLYLPYNAAIPANVTAYTGTLNASAHTLAVTPIEGNVLPANTAVLVKVTGETINSNTNYDFAYTAAAAPTIANNDLQGVLVSTTAASLEAATAADDVCMTLGWTQEYGVALYKPAGNTVDANRAYIMLPSSWFTAGAPIRIVEATDETTAVENTSAASDTQKIIENGKLVIIKNGVRYNSLGARL